MHDSALLADCVDVRRAGPPDLRQASAGGVSIGTGRTATFETATAVFNYLPQVGSIGVLAFNMTNPTHSSAGAFGGDDLALTLNVRFSDADLLAHTSWTALGDLHICGFSILPSQTVRQFLANANTVLGGGSIAGLTPNFADIVADSINGAFVGGAPSTFAQNYLVNGSCA